jgi:hypothetical protein
MLAFNLGLFFRNLRGQPVRFSARDGDTEVQFVGGVRELLERTELDTQLTVVLTHRDLALRLVFDEGDEGEQSEEPRVRIRLTRESNGEEAALLETSFAFVQVRLQPAEEQSESASAPAQGSV